MFRNVSDNPDQCRQSSTMDQKILFVRCSQCSHRSISSNNHTEQTPHLCCSDSSTRTEEVQQISDNAGNAYSDRQSNSTYQGDVLLDIVPYPNNDQKFVTQLNQMEACSIDENKEQILDYVHQLQRIIEESPSETQISKEVKGQNDGTSPNTPVEDALGEEPE